MSALVAGATPALATTLTSDDARAAFAPAKAERSQTWNVATRSSAEAMDDADLAGLTIAMAVHPAAGRGAAGPAAARAAPKRTAHLPEPATWVMLILGFGAIGATVRRQLRRSDERFEEHIRRIVASADDQ